MLIAALDSSTHKWSRPDMLWLMAQAVTLQLHRHVAPSWGTLPWSVLSYQDISQVPAGSCRVYFFDNADAAGALGYHDVDRQGMPYGKVFIHDILSNGGTEFSGANSIPVTFSHECLEAAGDPDVNIWAQGGDGTLTPQELCDAVEGDSYDMEVATGAGPVSVPVSNFLLPDYFRLVPRSQKFDYLGRLSAPYPAMTSGGYVSVMKEGAVHQIFAEQYPEWKVAGKQHPASRTARRVAAMRPAA